MTVYSVVNSVNKILTYTKACQRINLKVYIVETVTFYAVEY